MADVIDLRQTGEGIDAETFERGSKVLRAAGVGRRLTQLDIKPELLPIAISRWIEHCDDGASMILAGPPGTGKTVSAVAAVRLHHARVFEREPRRSYRPVFAKAADLYSAVFRKNYDLLGSARRAPLLVVDDWGSAYEHDWPVAELEGIIDRRWEDRRPTIVTTNLDPEQGADSLRARMPRSFDRLTDEPGPGVVILDRASMRGWASPASTERGRDD